MYTKRTTQAGFSTPKVILISVGVAIVAGTGLYGWQTNQSLNNINASQQIVAPTQAAQPALKTYTLPNEKLTFSYPADWTVKTVTPDTVQSNAVTLTSADGFTVNVRASTEHPSLDMKPPVLAADDVSFTNQAGFIDLIGGSGMNGQDTTMVQSVNLSTNSIDSLAAYSSHNITGGGYISIRGSWLNGTSVASKSVSDVHASKDYKAFVDLIRSAHY